MRRHHHNYLRNRYLTNPAVLAALGDAHRQLAIDQARSLGLLDPNGPGSYTHPDLSRMLYADGKVITPLFKSWPDDTRLDKTTGELRTPRHEPDGHLHFQGDGNLAYGIKFVLVAVRTTDHIAAASSSTPNGSRHQAAKPPPPWTASLASPRSHLAPKESSMTPRCEVSTTNDCCETSAGCR